MKVQINSLAIEVNNSQAVDVDLSYNENYIEIYIDGQADNKLALEEKELDFIYKELKKCFKMMKK